MSYKFARPCTLKKWFLTFSPFVMSPSIIVLADFLDDSNRVLSYAAGLAVPLKAHLLLLHARHNQLLAPDDFDTCLTLAGEQKTFYALEKLAAAQPVPTEVDITNDSLFDAVREIIRERELLLVVMGQSGFAGTLPELVTRTAMGLLRRVACPLLLVPAVGWDQVPPRCLLLAVDCEPFKLGAQRSTVYRLLRALQGTLEVVHITDDEHPRPTASALLDTITQNDLVEDTLDGSLHLHERHHAHVASGVLEEVAQLKADMLVVVARHRSFWGSLFHQSITAQLIQESSIPVLVLPAED
jgi:nucleotide-binding universal stress UspA family protein